MSLAYPYLSPPQQPDELGRLGSYRVLREIGRGGMGIVFVAEQQKLKRKVALKVMTPQTIADPAARARFLREAQAGAAAAEIQSDHVVSIYEFNDDGDCLFIAMPLLLGETLAARLSHRGRLPLQEAARIGAEIATGLAAAHQRGLIHRDIKPANIWLEEPSDRVKLLDFGLARPLEGDVSQLTVSGAILGTPAYMAPEQARGGKADQRSDLFSLGAVLYRLVTDREPFSGSNLVSQLTSLAIDTPPPPATIVDTIPPELDALVMQLLAKSPEDRPASAAEVAQRLRACGEKLAAEGTATTIQLPPPKPRPSAPPPSPQPAMVAVVVGTLAILAGLAFWSMTAGRRDKNGGPTPSNGPPLTSSPFSADQAQQLQATWAKKLEVPPTWENSLGMRFQLIPPGEFQMGATPDEHKRMNVDEGSFWWDFLRSELPQHREVAATAFYLGENEVSQAEYLRLVAKNPSSFSSSGSGKDLVAGEETAWLPVENLTWDQATEFCQSLNKHDRLASGYRLPKEVEWEWACRAGTTGLFWCAEDDLERYANYRSSGRTQPVGRHAPNPFGLRDMHGNVWEWCQEKWHVDNKHVVRGGSYDNDAINCRSAQRLAMDYPASIVGMRVAIDVEAVKELLKKK
jgi:serine/threonine protein kinase